MSLLFGQLRVGRERYTRRNKGHALRVPGRMEVGREWAQAGTPWSYMRGSARR